VVRELQFEDPADAVIDGRFVQLADGNQINELGVEPHRIKSIREQNEVNARVHTMQHNLTQRVMVGNRAYLHGIRDQHAIGTEITAQNIAHDDG